MRTAPCTGLYVFFRYYVGQRDIMAILGVADQTGRCWETPCRASFCPVSVLSRIVACTNLGKWPDFRQHAWISCTKHCFLSLKQHPLWGGSDFRCTVPKEPKNVEKTWFILQGIWCMNGRKLLDLYEKTILHRTNVIPDERFFVTANTQQHESVC